MHFCFCFRSSQAARETQWRRWSDKVGAADALSAFEPGDVKTLLIVLGRCGWIDAFDRYGFTPEMLKTLTVPELQLIVAGCDGTGFGAVWSFVLTIQHIDRVGGLPRTAAAAGAHANPAADPAGDSVQLWSPETVAAHVTAAGMAEAAEQCLANRVSGDVLLSMQRADIFAQLKLASGAEYHQFEKIVVVLRAREAALPVAAPAAQVAADAGRLSAAMVQALAGEGEPAEFPLDFLRRCTHGFNDSHLEGQGAFGSV